MLRDSWSKTLCDSCYAKVGGSMAFVITGRRWKKHWHPDLIDAERPTISLTFLPFLLLFNSYSTKIL
jgi:hypothetical protein